MTMEHGKNEGLEIVKSLMKEQALNKVLDEDSKNKKTVTIAE